MNKTGKQFEKILSEQPTTIMAKIDEHEMKGQAMVALVMVEEGQIGLMIGGAFNLPTMMHMVESLEDAKQKLIHQMAELTLKVMLGKEDK